MSLNQFTKDQLTEMSLIEMAYEILKSKKQPASFHDILDEIKEALGLSEEEVRARIAQFYTDINIDGRFLSVGENRWGLRIWYPVDQTEEEFTTPAKPKKKKKAKKVVDEDEDLDLDEFDEEELDFEDDLLDEDEEDEEELDELEEDDLLEEDDEEFDEDEEELLEDEEEFEELEDEFDEDEEEL